MVVDLRPLGAIAAGLLLVGCTAGAVKPQPVAAARSDRSCVTGTRIPSSEACASNVRVYTDTDVQTTGATTVPEALRLLDPSITISR